MALLEDLPTSVISQIVEQLNPRLYIDFIRYLPPEICLKILGYLDPVSLLNVARSCRAWYDLALDRKLWEKLYYLEGWHAKPAEIERWERIVNEGTLSGSGQLPRTMRSQNGHAQKKQAFAISPGLDSDQDYLMVDVDAPLRQEPADMEAGETSIFGGPLEQASTLSAGTRLTQPMLDLQVHVSRSSSKGSNGKGIDKGKGKASSPAIREESMPEMVSSYGIPKQTLWMWDGPDNRYKINWKYLYTMRRRLESNWELGKYTNFQLPHPDHPEEGHHECIYSLQYNSQYLVSGSRDRTIRIWDLQTRRLVRPPLAAHGGSVLCLQFDSDPAEDLIVSGSSDSDVILWRFSTGELIQRLRDAHRESVLNVRFDKRILVTCSKDKTIKIFNRRPLRHGDMGYKVPEGYVDPVPHMVKNYGYGSPLDDLPVIPPYTMIGVLEGHGAAVNAVQIHDREVVSASGDRHVKVWDWPTEACTRTIVGHNKGIACVQYDGRRIVSGSSDNEVKVFDRQTGLEVASLRSHINLVRTVQAGFADLPYSADEDEAEAKRVDAEYFKALESGQLDESSTATRQSRRRPGNAGSRRPEDITAYGAKLPPGGGGGKYGRIVSGSYDTTIIIWRRDKEGIWKDQHHLKQEDAAAAALRPEAIASANATVTSSGPVHPSVPTRRPSRHQGSRGAAGPSTSPHGSPRTQSASAPPAPGRPTTPTNTSLMTVVESPIHAITTPASIEEYRHMIDNYVPRGPQELAQLLASYPTILTQRSHLQTAIDREPSPFIRSQLRQAVNTAVVRTQFEQARQRREAIRNFERQLDVPGGSTATAADAGEGSSSNTQVQRTPQGPGIATHATAQGSLTAPYIQDANAAAAAADRANRGRTRQQMGFPVTARGDHLHQVPQSRTSTPDHHPSQAPAAEPSSTAVEQASPATPNPDTAPTRRTRPHIPPVDAANPARVFKLQFDAHRIICCSQTSTIVGWDFCNDDAELMEVSRFFAPVQ
jgi:F-box and WD-40 domain protein 1/11